MKFEAILFDCDGVLVDSEPITNGVLCAMLNEAGWALSSEECMRLFIGKTVRSEAARIEAHTGQPLTDAWMAEFYARRNVRLDAEHAEVEFVARYRVAGRAVRLHERSRFVREDGRWYYLEGDQF